MCVFTQFIYFHIWFYTSLIIQVISFPVSFLNKLFIFVYDCTTHNFTLYFLLIFFVFICENILIHFVCVIFAWLISPIWFIFTHDELKEEEHLLLCFFTRSVFLSAARWWSRSVLTCESRRPLAHRNQMMESELKANITGVYLRPTALIFHTCFVSVSILRYVHVYVLCECIHVYIDLSLFFVLAFFYFLLLRCHQYSSLMNTNLYLAFWPTRFRKTKHAHGFNLHNVHVLACYPASQLANVYTADFPNIEEMQPVPSHNRNVSVHGWEERQNGNRELNHSQW